MKFNKFLTAAAISAAVVSSVSSFAEEPPVAEKISSTVGEVQFKGELVNSACGLAASSSPLLVDFGQITTSSLKDKKHAGNVRKDIELQGCDTTVAKSVKVTYNPNTADTKDTTLAAFTSGTATGAGIGLTDSGNQPVKWGVASTSVNLVDGAVKIPFVAYVKANSDEAVTPGTFQSSINFKIDYQ